MPAAFARFMFCFTALGCALASCGGGGSSVAPDATPQDPDATPTPDAFVSCNVLFLNFEGATLQQAGVDNPAADQSVLLANAMATIAAYQVGNPNRAAAIAAITTQVRTILQPLGVAVVTERPASGVYAMTLLGGVSTDIGAASNLVALAPARGDCQPEPAVITFVFDSNLANAQVGNAVIGTYGITRGIPITTLATDCMCFSAGSCTMPTSECSIGGAGTARDPTAQCGTGGSFDEHAAFVTALHCP